MISIDEFLGGLKSQAMAKKINYNLHLIGWCFIFPNLLSILKFSQSIFLCTVYVTSYVASLVRCVQ